MLATKTYKINDRTRYGLIERNVRIEIKKAETSTGATLDFRKTWDGVVVEDYRTDNQETIQRLQKDYGFTWE